MKLSDIISPEKFRDLATYITLTEKKLGLDVIGTEVQDDLIKFADALDEVESKVGQTANKETTEKALLWLANYIHHGFTYLIHRDIFYLENLTVKRVVELYLHYQPLLNELENGKDSK